MTLSEARLAVSQCEQDIQTLKATLRRIGTTSTTTTTTGGGDGDGDGDEEENTTATQNQVQITLTKVEGWPEPEANTPPPVVLTLQMSSPIETQTVASSPETVACFRGVDTAMAVCTVDTIAIAVVDRTATTYTVATVKDKPAFEVATWCRLPDPHQPTPHITDVVIPIRIAPRTTTTTTTASEKETEEKTAPTAVMTTEPKTDGTNKNNEEESSGVVRGTVTVQVVYTPSRQDQREAVYEVLNQTSQRKATALATLRKLATTTAPATAEGNTHKASSVQPGFLNRTTTTAHNNKDDAEDDHATTTHRGRAWLGRTSTRLTTWWTRVTGPQSLVRKAAFLTVVTKDYWIFLGAVGFCQSRGHLLALPPPV